MLPWTQEEGAIDEGIPVENVHDVLAKHTRYPVHFVAGIAGQYEYSSLVVTDTAFVFHLDVIRVDLVLGQDIERAVVVSVLEYATTRVMPGPVLHDCPSWWLLGL